MMEETLLIIKPDAFHRSSAIINRIKDEGFEIMESKTLQLTPQEAAEFYEVHRGKPFFEELVEFISSGTIMVLRLARSDAVAYLREVVGATNPSDSLPGTLRKEFGTSVCANAVHASDSNENAIKELAFFFENSPQSHKAAQKKIKRSSTTFDGQDERN